VLWGNRLADSERNTLTHGDSNSFTDSYCHSYADSNSRWNTNTVTLRHATGARVRRHHDIAWGWLGADQPQHDDRDNGMVPGK
jgi:hypothetical protein